MNIINLVFDVYGYVPKWINDTLLPTKNILNDSKYRIYVDTDLIVERNWVWNNDIFLRENIFFNSTLSEHTVRLEPVVFIAKQIKFTIKNIMVNDKLLITNTDQLELSFKV